MIRLDKMLLINWHYLRHQLLEFKDVNFLTGKNGAGKSTIIDALQLMFLGDTQGQFFNKAANERSTRTLKGYLRGEVAEDEDTSIVYLRNDQDFTSYIVLAFTNTADNRHFCLGAVFDSYRDGESKHRFFYLKDALPPHHFYLENVPMNIRALRAYLTNHYTGKQYQLFDSNSEYRQVMRGVLGSLNERFFRLFKKAVPFSPIMNIKQFITEFVCDTENEVDITHMQENIRQYKQLEEELAWVEKRVGVLEQINKQYSAYREESERLLIQQYLLDRGYATKSEDELTTHRGQIESLTEKIIQLSAAVEAAEQTFNHLTKNRDDLLEERARSDIYQQEQTLTQKKQALEREITEAKNSAERLTTLLYGYHRSWREILTWCKEHLDFRTNELSSLPLLERGTHDYSLLNYESLTELKKQMDTYHASLQKAHYDLDGEKADLEAEAQRLRQEIEGLKRGIKPYAPSLIELQAAIINQCGEASNPSIFAELLEIKARTWEKAIEGYLHTQKFYLLVNPQFFMTALKTYDRLKNERGFYDLGLVDMEKVLKLKPTALPGSLATEVETENPLARAYADYLLGRVMKCENVTDLRKHHTAITPDGMLYHNYVARQLHPKRFEQPYIGRKAIAQQIIQKTERLSQLEQRLTQLKPLVAELCRICSFTPLSLSDIDHTLILKTKASALPAHEAQWQTIVDELGRLDLSYLSQLEKRIAACDVEIQLTQTQLKSRIERRAEATAEKKAKVEWLPSLSLEVERLMASVKASYDPQWAEDVGKPRFDSELKTRGNAANILIAFTPTVKRTETIKQDKWEALVDLRINYNRDFKGSYSATAPGNNAYDDELTRLRDSFLLDYREKIKAAKERAQEQFREDFISKLRANIERVEEQIKDINRAIKDNFFGRDRYKFTASPNTDFRRFYEMITDDMLIEGFNLFSGSFLEKHGDTVDELFRQIVDIGEGALTADQRQRLAENLERFTDYRTYLDFDMINIDDEGRESRLSRVLTKKSGGETQTPFYIAVLASFLQLYRVRQGEDDTLRIIIFDEAYSKMDHQRIQESVRLIRDLGLQVILSAPTEKIGDIAPLMDRNLCVIRVKRETMVKAFDPQEIMEMGA